MNKNEFIAYLEDPSKVEPEVIPQLKEVLKAYPAFQTGHVLLLKSLYQTGDLMYEKYLSQIAAYAGNRELLYDYILGSDQKDKDVPEDLPITDIAAGGKNTEKPKQEAVENEANNVPEPSEELPAKKHSDQRYFDSVTMSNNYFDIREELIEGSEEDKYEAVHSFSQWLDIMNRKPQNQPTEKPEMQDNKWALIDSFINDNRAFVPSKEKPVDKEGVVHDLSEKSVSDKDEFMTETLARIYIRQKNFDKALHIFQKLSLKYPEKSVYFAGQIKIVEELRNNEN